MSDENYQENSTNVEEIEDITIDDFVEIPFELFSKKNNKTTHLINNSDPENELNGKNDWYPFTLDEPVFVSRIEIVTDGYTYHRCDFKWNTVGKGEQKNGRIKLDGNLFSTEVNQLIDSFSFKPDKRSFSTATIKKVVVIGFSLQDLEKATAQIAEIESVKAKVIKSAQAIIDDSLVKEDELGDLIQKIDDNTEILSELNLNIEQTKQKKEEFDTELKEISRDNERLVTSIASNEVRLEQQASTIDQRNAERENISQDVAKEASKLKALESNIYLFPSELGEFAKRGGEDKTFYWKLAIAPMVILAFMALALLFNAAKLTTVFDEKDKVQILSILVTRLPYVIIASAIIGVCYKISQSLIIQIMRIDSQVRSLAKISVIATDVSAASVDDMNMDDELSYHLRTGLKMDLLREHLKTYISEDYSYQKSDRVKSRVKTVSEKLKREKEEKEIPLDDSNGGVSE